MKVTHGGTGRRWHVHKESCPGGSRLLQLQTEVSFPCEAVNQDRSFHGAESWGSRWCERSDINMGSLQTESALDPVGRRMRWRVFFRLDSHLGCSPSGQLGSDLENKGQKVLRDVDKERCELPGSMSYLQADT